MKLRLGTKFILIVVGILSITLAANTILFMRSQHRLLEDQLIEQGKALGHFVALVSPQAILGYDFLLLNEYAREISYQRDVVYGVIVDRDGRPLTNFINRDNPQISALIKDDERMRMNVLLPQLQAEADLIPLEFIIVHDDETLGYFKVGLSRTQLIEKTYQQLIVQLATYGLIILFLSVAIYLVFRFNVLFPVQRLIRASRNVEKGEYHQVDVESRDEMGVLTEAFNSMVRGIRQERANLHHQANYDALTELPNRMMAVERLSYEISRSRREQQRLAVLFIDLDDFKVVNDTMGHATGDQLLIEVGLRLKSRLRDVDTIARLGGDEFLLLLPWVGCESEIEQITDRLIDAVSEPLHLKSREVKVHCSIGVAFYPRDGESADLLMANADNAMYQAKNQPRSSVCFFTQEMNIRVQERLQMEQDLHLAMDRGELELYFQPLVDAATGGHRGAEALLRWIHPQKGFISPEVFIPLAETTGQIIAIGEWVLREAAKQWALWHKNGLTPGYIAVNVSRVQFEERLSWIVGEVIAHHRLPPGALELEVTEGVLLEDHELIARELNQFRAMGVKLSLDDFGTGFSSLSYLKRFRFDVLKIDRSFVSGLPEDAEDVSLVKAIIAMAHSMGLKVVAEGVETQEQHDFLRGLGCDYGQGYLFAKPMPSHDYEAYLRRAQGVGDGDLSALSMTVYPIRR
ncbi:MAG: EAL domain-containing protein [Halopseudomonas sp.]